MDLENRDLLDAQATGLACVYCGRSLRKDGSLTPLRRTTRPVPDGHQGPPGGRTLVGGDAFRCEPPCPEAEAAYRARIADPRPGG